MINDKLEKNTRDLQDALDQLLTSYLQTLNSVKYRVEVLEDIFRAKTKEESK